MTVWGWLLWCGITLLAFAMTSVVRDVTRRRRYRPQHINISLPRDSLRTGQQVRELMHALQSMTEPSRGIAILSHGESWHPLIPDMSRMENALGGYSGPRLAPEVSHVDGVCVGAKFPLRSQ